MKAFLISAGLCLGLTTTCVFAGASFDTSKTSMASDTAASDGQSRFPFEFDLQYAHIGEGEVARSFREVEGLEEDYALARFVYTPRVSFGILRIGAAYERFEFDADDFFEVPGRLQSISAILGLDTQFSDSILVRFEAQPGFYSAADFHGDDFHVPFIFGGTYIYNPNLQFVLGVSVDYERSSVFLPGGGVRWRLGSQWVLNAVAPNPRLEYELNKIFLLYAGADIKASTFRVDESFGFRRGNLRLNDAVIDYTELRVGGGFEWKITPDLKLSLEGGYLPYRNFDFHRTDVRYHTEEGAPYGAIALHAAF